jgi:ketosteroid isomerase-like protein
MRSRIMWILAVLAVLVPSVATAQPCESEAHVSAAKAAIAQVWARYETARNQQDLEAWLALWDDNAVKLPPDRAPVAGKEAMRASIAWGPEDTVLDIRPLETEVFGIWAYSRGSYAVDVMDHRGSVVDHVEGKFLSVFKQQPDGSWLLYRDIDNHTPVED